MCSMKLLVFLLLLGDSLAWRDSTDPVTFSSEIMEHDGYEDTNSEKGENKLIVPGSKIIQIFNWIKASFGQNDSFIGRCFGAAHRLKMIMPFLLFKMGVIMTTLAFLTLISIKGLTIGIILLILNVGGILGKAAYFKQGQGHHQQNYIPWAPSSPAVHVHIHKDRDGHYNVDRSSGVHYDADQFETPHQYSPTAFSERISKSLNSTESIAEKLELVKLYKRLGLDVNSVLRRDKILINTTNNN